MFKKTAFNAYECSDPNRYGIKPTMQSDGVKYKLVHGWTYGDPDRPQWITVRYETSKGEKTIRQVYKERGVRGRRAPYVLMKGAMPDSDRVLYGLDTVAEGADLFVTEGEKCAAALHSLGLPAVTSVCGSKSAHKSNWKPTAKAARIIILRDNDEPGKDYADEVVQCLPPGLSARVVLLDNLPDGGDVCDWIAARHVDGWDGYRGMPPDRGDSLRAELLAAIEQAQDAAPMAAAADEAPKHEPAPLLPEHGAAFPVEALGDVIGGAARVIHEAVQAPLSMCCNSVLAAAALATQAHCNVKLGEVGEKPMSAYFLTVGESGERKSAVDGWALRAVREHEKKLREKHPAQVSDAKLQISIYEDELKRLQRKHKADFAGLREAVAALGKPPKLPPLPLRAIGDLTIEGLFQHLGDGWPSLGVFSDEGGTFTGGYACLQENMMKTLTGLSSLWDGKPLSRVRRGDGATVLAGKRVSLHLMLQPVAAGMLLNSKVADGQGFLSRCLVVWPQAASGIRIRTYRKTDPGESAEIQAFEGNMRGLLEHQPKMSTTGELEPGAMEPTPDAWRLWVDFANEIEAELGMDGRYRCVKPFANKVAEHAARLAGILALFEGSTHGVDEDYMRRGIVLARFYLSEAVRIKGESEDAAENEDAERLRRWLAEHQAEPFTLRDISTRVPNDMRGKERLMPLLEILEDAGYIAAAGAGPKRRWTLQRV
jgi:hypothetical protein